ncbi:MAG: DNA topoisomerase (ATP-hydrolyzing) [Clostridia bacterium]|nr:DNA topoisomerase (ATP-hydrolyzing) [Clostridia bacterium]
MAKRHEPEKPIVKDDPSRIIDTTMEDVMHNSMMPYSEHVILERALPRVEDGLKPVQRRILYTMMELGTTPDKPHRKCARIVGDCLGKYHPHGDSSVYGALVHLAQDFSMRAPLVDGHGNFGSVDGDGAAAMRYTEARMTPLAMQMLRDIEKDTVPFRLNFDDTLKEPDMIPARFPNLLVNGANGIAVGLATNIPPHNLGESIRAVIAQMDDPDITLDELMRILPGPDFPTGGVLVNNEEIRKGYETGRGKLTLRARVQIEDGSAGRKLLAITEIPYQINKAAMLEKILKLSEEKKSALGGIYDIRDESDRTGMRAVIELKKDTDPKKVLAYLYKYSDLQITFGVNMVAIAQGKPVLMNLKQMIGFYIDYQKQVVRRRTEYELAQAKARAHILEGLMIALDNLDEVIALIRASKSPKEAKIALMERFELSDVQAQAILDMRLQRLTNLEIESLRKEYADVLKLIDRLESILKSEKKLIGVIRKEMEEIAAEYADERRTVLEDPSDTPVELPDNTPVPEDAVVIYTRAGYLKRVDPAVLKRSPLPGPDEDPDGSPRWQMETTSVQTLYIFTDHGNCYPLSVGTLPVIRPRDRGQLLSGVLAGLEDDEQALFMMCAAQGGLASAPDLLFVTKNGVIKRSAAADYDVRSRKFSAVTLKKDDALLAIRPADDRNHILLLTRGGMSIRFELADVPVQGRTASGVRAVSPEPGDSVAYFLQPGEQDEIILLSDRGWGKRVPQTEFDLQHRGGKGVRCIFFNKNGSNGREIAGACAVSADMPALLRITQVRSGATLLSKKEILLQNRQGKGMPYVMAIMDDTVTGLEALPEKEVTET